MSILVNGDYANPQIPFWASASATGNTPTLFAWNGVYATGNLSDLASGAADNFITIAATGLANTRWYELAINITFTSVAFDDSVGSAGGLFTIRVLYAGYSSATPVCINNSTVVSNQQCQVYARFKTDIDATNYDIEVDIINNSGNNLANADYSVFDYTIYDIGQNLVNLN